MPLLVDGHNLIAQLPHLRLSDSDDEAQLVMLLRRYATRKRSRRVVVVFDHGVYGHPDNLNGYNVECHFAHSPTDADTELIRRIRAIKRTGQWQVVTSDRAVAGAARAQGVQVISSQAFARKLAVLREPTASMHEKKSEKPLNEAEIQDWLRLFGEKEDEER
jgi:predicted RNA-binding protein with PIN domain